MRTDGQPANLIPLAVCRGSDVSVHDEHPTIRRRISLTPLGKRHARLTGGDDDLASPHDVIVVGRRSLFAFRCIKAMKPTASIQLLSSQTSLPRSSHACAVVGATLFIIGGEINPREPASPFIHAFNLNGISSKCKGSSLEDKTLKPLETNESPPLRVGSAAVVVNGEIFVWGGRGGKAMTALDEGGRFWIFAPKTGSWSQSSSPTGDIPEPRSYHSLASIDVLPPALIQSLMA